MEKQEKKKCCIVHTMYDTVVCDLDEGHVGLHKSIYQGETLRWGIPSQEEMYNVKRTK